MIRKCRLSLISFLSFILLSGTTTSVWSDPLVVPGGANSTTQNTSYDGGNITANSTFINGYKAIFSVGNTFTIDAGSIFANIQAGGGEGGEGGSGGIPEIDNYGLLNNLGIIESGSYPCRITNRNTGSFLNNGVVNNSLFSNFGSASNNGTFTNYYSFYNAIGAVFTNTGLFINNGYIMPFQNYGTFTVSGAGNLDGSGSYVNGEGATLNITGNATLSPNLIIVNNGVINLAGWNGARVNLEVLSGDSSGTFINAGGHGLTVRGGAYSGSLGNLSSFEKEGGGTFLLLGNNESWSGNVNVNMGTLAVGNQFDTSGKIGNGAGALSVANGATAGGYGTMNFDHATFNPGSTLDIGVILGSTTSGKIVTTNNLDLTGATINVSHSGEGNPGTYVIAQYGSLTGFNPANVIANGLTEVPYVNGDVHGTITMEVQRAAVNNAEASPAAAIVETVSEMAHAQTSLVSHEMFKETFRFQRQGLSRSTPKQGKFYRGRTYSMGERESTLSMDSILRALADDGPIVADKTNHRLWASSYYMQGASGSKNNKSRDYHEGIVIGFEHRPHNKSWTLGFTASGGVGKQILPYRLDQKTKVNSKVSSLGFYHTLGFLENGSYSLVVNGILGHNTSERWGNPTPGFIYRANAKYTTKALSGSFMTAWKFVIQEDFSIRPDLGISMDINKRSGYTENSDFGGAARYLQSYAPQKSNSWEPYGGIGFRKKWKTENYEFKLTGVYEEGYSLRDTTSVIKVNTPSGPAEGTLIKSEGSGRRSQYVTAYASLQKLNSDWKFMIGYNGTFQKQRSSHAFTLKAECHF